MLELLHALELGILPFIVYFVQPAMGARPSLIPSLCTHFTRAGIEWRR